jgi:hypothetical protein
LRSVALSFAETRKGVDGYRSDLGRQGNDLNLRELEELRDFFERLCNGQRENTGNAGRSLEYRDRPRARSSRENRTARSTTLGLPRWRSSSWLSASRTASVLFRFFAAASSPASASTSGSLM